jgi:hypothetical protein
MAFKINADRKLVAFNYAERDTVPSDTDTTKKDTSMVFNSQRRMISPALNFNEDMAELTMKNQPVADIRKQENV